MGGSNSGNSNSYWS